VGDVHVVCHPNDVEGVDAADANEKLPTDQLSTAVNAIVK
jgi:hypothetical protein